MNECPIRQYQTLSKSHVQQQNVLRYRQTKRPAPAPDLLPQGERPIPQLAQAQSQAELPTALRGQRMAQPDSIGSVIIATAKRTGFLFICISIFRPNYGRGAVAGAVPPNIASKTCCLVSPSCGRGALGVGVGKLNVLGTSSGFDRLTANSSGRSRS